MIIIRKSEICEKSKLNQGQGQKVKGQGQLCNFVKTCALVIYHEPIIVH